MGSAAARRRGAPTVGACTRLQPGGPCVARGVTGRGVSCAHAGTPSIISGAGGIGSRARAVATTPRTGATPASGASAAGGVGTPRRSRVCAATPDVRGGDDDVLRDCSKESKGIGPITHWTFCAVTVLLSAETRLRAGAAWGLRTGRFWRDQEDLVGVTRPLLEAQTKAVLWHRVQFLHRAP